MFANYKTIQGLLKTPLYLSAPGCHAMLGGIFFYFWLRRKILTTLVFFLGDNYAREGSKRNQYRFMNSPHHKVKLSNSGLIVK